MIVLLLVVILLLITYLLYLGSQINSISNQLEKRLRDNTRQPISMELINSQLGRLTIKLNECLKAEEKVMLDNFHKEKEFKELIANLSHDLRTPLTAVRGYQQLLEKTELTEEQERMLKCARDNSDELGTLIEHFFEYSYLVNADPDIHIKKVNLASLLTDCLVAAVPALEQSGLELDFNEEAVVFVSADQEMVTRVIQNLIRNCIQYSSGNIKPTLHASNELGILTFENSVLDSTDIVVERMFDRFYTSDKARGKNKGLGLAIVKLLVEQMNGEVRATLKKNNLSIEISLPIYK